DTEVLAHLIGHHLDMELVKGKLLTPELVTSAIESATRKAKGTFAIALVHAAMPGHVFGARRGSPLVIGVGRGESFLASDVSPIVQHTRKVIYLQDGDVTAISEKDHVITANGKRVSRPVTVARWSPEAAARGKFPHYMLKEIYEQPDRVADVLRRTLRAGS